MEPKNNWQAKALHRILSDTQELAKSYNELFNHSTDPQLKNFLNDLTPELIAIQMKLQDRLREQITAPAV